MAAKATHQLINVIHHIRSKYDPDWFGKGQCVLFVEKVTTPDGVVRKRVIKEEDPTVRYFVTKPEFQPLQHHAEFSFDLEKCDEYESKVDDLFKDIASLTGQMAYYNETRGPGANRRRQQLHANRFLHGSDVNVADSYIDRFMEHYKDCLDTVSPLSMAFADIEVDVIEHEGFPEETQAPCPVSLINYFHGPTKKMTHFALRNMVRENPLLDAIAADPSEHKMRLLAEVNRGVLERPRKGADGKKLDPLVPPNTTWQEIATLLGLNGAAPSSEAKAMARCTDYELIFFDDELSLLRAFLHRINEVDRPDILAFWNMRFDIVTIMNRLRKLGTDPQAEFTPTDFGKWQMADYSVDAYSSDPVDCGDTFNVTSHTIYVDQMILYATLRKTSGKRESYGLDFTLKAEIGEGKLKYEGRIHELPYTNYSDYLLYGALDVVPMATLEQKTDDIAQAYQLMMTTRTRFSKIMKKTVCLRNLAAVFFRERGLVLSNNRNRLKERTDSEQFRGA